MRRRGRTTSRNQALLAENLRREHIRACDTHTVVIFGYNNVSEVPMSEHGRRFLPVVSLLVASSCGGPSPEGAVNGTLAGRVYVTGPTAGAVVTAYQLDLDSGDRGEPIAVAAP